MNSQMFKLDLAKAEEPEIKLPTSVGSLKRQESSRKTPTSALLPMPKPLTVWITTNSGKILREMGIPDHLTCLLIDLYAGQEATVRTGRGTTDWFQIGKGVRQGCTLSPCLFNLYAQYIMRNAGLEEAQAGVNQIGKGVCQGCILSPCLFNLYAEYIMRNAELDEAQGGIRIIRRNINNLRYADDTTLMAESEEELKSLLMKVKEESENLA